MAKKYSHRELVTKAHSWLRNSGKCSVAFLESGAGAYGEMPDAIGFATGGLSIMVECKTSRADFLTDRKKMFRKFPEFGVGDYRYFLFSDKSIATPEELPEGWGLLVVSGSGLKVVKKAVQFKDVYKRGEVSLLKNAHRPEDPFSRYQSEIRSINEARREDRFLIRWLRNELKKAKELLEENNIDCSSIIFDIDTIMKKYW